MKKFRNVFIICLVLLLVAGFAGCNVYTAEDDFADEYNPVSDGLICAQSAETELWGYLDKRGNTVIDFAYSEAAAFEGGLAIVCDKNGKYGALNKRGETVIKFVYDKLLLDDGILVATKSSNSYLIDKSGNSISRNFFSAIGDFSDGYAVAYRTTNNQNTYYILNGKGEITLTLTSNYSDITTKHGYVVLTTTSGKCGLFDVNGNQLIGFDYLNLSLNKNSITSVKNIGETAYYGVLNYKNNTLIPFEYDYLSYVESSNTYLAEKNGKCGLIGDDGKVLIAFEHDRIRSFGDGVFLTGDYLDDKQEQIALTFFNTKNQAIFTPYGVLTDTFLNGYVSAIDENGKTVVLSNKGKVVFTSDYEYVGYYSSKVTSFYDGEKFGLINLKGKVLIEAKYTYELMFVNGLSIAAKGGKIGVINTSGKTIVPFNYSAIKTKTETFEV